MFILTAQTRSKEKTVYAKIYNFELLIRNASNGRKYLHDIVEIKRETSSSLSQSWIAKMDKNSSRSLNNSISQNSKKSTLSTKKAHSFSDEETKEIQKSFANAKKIGSLILGSLPKSNAARIYTQPIKHSIADFLNSVKSLPLTNEVFSADGAQKLGVNSNGQKRKRSCCNTHLRLMRDILSL